jgi:hypothetical protein
MTTVARRTALAGVLALACSDSDGFAPSMGPAPRGGVRTGISSTASDLGEWLDHDARLPPARSYSAFDTESFVI